MIFRCINPRQFASCLSKRCRNIIVKDVLMGLAPHIEEIREMASYLAIRLPEEAYLLFIAKLAVEATLPIGWREERDEAHDRSIFYDAVAQK